ncbi:MAG: 1,4-dihydroxy-2-naphthoate octaprenyltransferase, partial [Actinomycetota bacterium]
MTTREQWIAGARPKTLPAAIAPVLVGTSFAGYNASFLHTLLALIVALALQVGVNYANDYSDGIKGTDTDRVGPMRLVGSGAATAESVKKAAYISFTIAALAGLILASRT